MLPATVPAVFIWAAPWLHAGCWQPFRWPPTTPPANRPSPPPCSAQVPCPLPDCKAPISAAECGLVLTPEEAATLGKVGGAGRQRRMSNVDSGYWVLTPAA